MPSLKPICLLGLLLFSSPALARDRASSGHHRPATVHHASAPAHVSVPSISFGINLGNIWVSGYWDHNRVYHPGYWRPAHRDGWVWVDGYRDRYGHWHEGYWRKR
jgi:hypothetical protein